jgi:hypothetical protein
MRKVPFVFCLLRNPQPLLPKIWKLHPSNTEKHWQLLDSSNKRQLPNTMDYSTKIFCTSLPPLRWFPRWSVVAPVYRLHGSSAVLETTTDYYHEPSRAHTCKFNTTLETTWRGNTKSVVPRDCSRRVGSHIVEYGPEVSLLSLVWCLCVSPGNYNVLYVWLVLNIGAGIFTFLNI